MVIWILTLAAALYLLSLRGRRNHPGLERLRGWSYAHRGLHDEEKPENSMAAFRAALEHGYGIEFDLHLLKDGNLGVMHDSALLRTTGREGRMEELTTEDLKNYHLGGTEETIPEFRQVLELFDGQAPLIIELKSVDNNYARLTETACAMLEGYSGPYCLESFDPRCIRWLRKNRPELIRGQLAENSMGLKGAYPWLLRFVTTNHLENFLTLPDFIAYRYADRKTLSNAICRGLWKIQGVSWTIRTQQEYDTAVREGWLPIFENFLPETGGKGN